MVSENTSATGGGCCSSESGERCGNGLEKHYPTTAIRFGVMHQIGEFSHSPQMKFTCGAKVVIQSQRGIEIGEQVSLTCTGCSKSVSRAQMMKYVKSSGPDYLQLRSGRILREATPDDLSEERHILESAREKLAFCQARADETGLKMKMVECEHLFGGERIVFYFRVRGEGRVDFRDLVRLLASEYRTRIEMRQVGARDEARLVADYETCGRECCCKNFLKTLRPISMRMAKMQKATLDPSKVAGRCGRLKCCLRYEQEGYESLDRKLPRVGTRVRTSHGDGYVVARQILTQLLQVRDDDDRVMTVVIEDVLERDVAPPDKSPSVSKDAPPADRPEEAPAESDAPRRRRRRRRRSEKPRDASEADGQSESPADEPKPDAGDASSSNDPSTPMP